MTLEFAVDARSVLGKQTKRLRREGTVPGVVYGKGTDSIPVQVDAKAFESLYHTAGRTTIFQLAVPGAGTKSAIIKSVQRHPLSGRAVHVDFFLPDLTVELQVDVPLVFVGEAPAIEATGGSLFTSLDHLKISALPADLPREITVDVSSLVDLEAAIHVGELGVESDTVHVLNDPEEMVARVLPPRVIEEEPTEEVEGEEGEGEEGAEGEGEGPSGEGEGGSAGEPAEGEG
ncbi:MAG TPA: 50S ribosomal protein L25 [Candidatus Limnocylindria bacterium]|jgi:large subunit ribosomal protein L25